jgi:hypothetical protein
VIAAVFKAITVQAIVTIGIHRAVAAVGDFIAAEGAGGRRPWGAAAVCTYFGAITVEPIVAAGIRRTAIAPIGTFIAAQGADGRGAR